MKTLSISWQEVPAVRLTLPLILGGFIYILIPGIDPKGSFLFLLFLFFSIGFFNRLFWGVSFYLILALCGYMHIQHNDQALGDSITIPTDSIYLQNVTVVNTIWDPIHERWRGKAKTKIQELEGRGLNVYYWMEQKDSSQQLKEGDHIIGKFALQKARKAKMPGAFDFREYLNSKNIGFTIYIPAYLDYSIYTPSRSGSLMTISSWRRTKIDDIGFYTDSLAHSLLKAVLFGDSKSLPDKVRKQFADAGMAHILAVSGMHVGILILIIQIMLRLIFKSFRGKMQLQFILIISSVWMYVALCDFAASASRAAIMASFYYLGKACKTTAPGLNTLGLSGLVLFLWDPFVLLDLGAQLSFSAMLGILLSFPFWQYVFLRWTPMPENWATLIALSFAAQLGVAPLLLYHFGTIPILFWLFSIPAAYLAVFLFAGGWILVLLSEFFPVAATYWGLVMDAVLGLWTFLMDFIFKEGLPKIEIPYFPISYFICFLGFTVALVKCLHSNTKRKLFNNLYFLLFLYGCFLFIKSYDERKTEVKAIKVENETFTLFKSNKEVFVLGDSDLKNVYDNSYLFNQLYSAYDIEKWQYVPIEDHLVKDIVRIQSVKQATNSKWELPAELVH